jgi:hypothetical protein
MVIDGVGTNLAPLNYTNANQARIRKLCKAFGKSIWVDVECADFHSYEPMSIGRFRASIEVAAQHADQIVAFCFFNYMSPDNKRPAAKKLYEAYARYRETILKTIRH